MTVYITYTFCSQTVDFLWDSRMEARSAAGCSGEKRTGVSRFFQAVEKACHCEPVRAAKQVPLGCRLAWQSVSKTHDFHILA